LRVDDALLTTRDAIMKTGTGLGMNGNNGVTIGVALIPRESYDYDNEDRTEHMGFSFSRLQLRRL
jgi:hypothetical protein